MAGIEPLPSLSDSQITAMAGGPALRIEAVASAARGARLDPGDILKGPFRLRKALVDSGLALPLLIQVAQQRQSCVFKAPDAHLKSLASLYDTVSHPTPQLQCCILFRDVNVEFRRMEYYFSISNSLLPLPQDPVMNTIMRRVSFLDLPSSIRRMESALRFACKSSGPCSTTRYWYSHFYCYN